MIIDLSKNQWSLTGYIKNKWKTENIMETGDSTIPEYYISAVTIPGSVHTDLLKNHLIDDYNVDLNAQKCEWIENREWVYKTTFFYPEQPHDKVYIDFEGLDYSGQVFLNQTRILEFKGTHLTWSVDVTEKILYQQTNQLTVVFDCPPETTGQVGYTSEEKTLKPRFNYTWDWCPRLVNIGIWGGVAVRSYDSARILYCNPQTHMDGTVDLSMELDVYAKGEYEIVSTAVCKDDTYTFCHTAVLLDAHQAIDLSFCIDSPELWWINQTGEPNLYDFTVQVKRNNQICDMKQLQIGFRSIEFSGKDADDPYPYLLKINGKPQFIRGINWVPLSPFYGTVTEADYKKVLLSLKEMNINMIRIWGGGILETETFYNICDQLGILIWQEFPQCSSGIDNVACEQYDYIGELTKVVISDIKRRRTHPSLAVWCGGNELLFHNFHPMSDASSYNLHCVKTLVSQHDPHRQYYPCSPNGDHFSFDEHDVGNHMDVHGPWDYLGDPEHYRIFNMDDSRLKSEVGTAGPMRFRELCKYVNRQSVFPADRSNVFWTNRSNWWIRDAQLKCLFGAEVFETPERLFSCWQFLQYESLRYSSSNMRRKFPNTCGYIVWMGNEPYPNNSNTSVLEYKGAYKPAYYALQKTFAKYYLCVEYNKINYDIDEDFFCKLYLCSDDSSDSISGDNMVSIRVLRQNGAVAYHADYPLREGLIAEIKLSCREIDSDVFVLDFDSTVPDLVSDRYSFCLNASSSFSNLYQLPLAVLKTHICKDELYIKNVSDVIAQSIFVYGYDEHDNTINYPDAYFTLLPNEEKRISKLFGTASVCISGLNVKEQMFSLV